MSSNDELSNISVYNANYVILTREQFAHDYPNADIPDDTADDARALVIHDDEDMLIASLWGTGNDFATFTADLAKYAAAQANPGEVLPKVGRNVTELAGG